MVFAHKLQCNFKCHDCSTNFFTVRAYDSEFAVLDDLRFFANNYKDLIISFSGGDLSVFAKRREIMSVLSQANFSLSLLTNASVFINEITDVNVTSILVSIDAGTCETFTRVKGVNCFEKVAKNVEKYSRIGKRVDLKYIMFDGMNDNEADIDGFVEIAARINALIHVSCNYTTKRKLSEKAKNMIIRLFKKSYQKGLKIQFNPESYFDPEDLVYLKSKTNY